MEQISLKFVVIGDEGSGKEQFQKQFLDYYKGTADVNRKTDDLHVIKNLKTKKNIKIWLHVIKEITAITQWNFEMHGIFFCYSPNHLNNLINLEKNWIEPLASKVDHCFLVPKAKDLHPQEDSLDQQQQGQVSNKVKKLEKSYQLKRSTEYDNIKSFLDEIMNTFLDVSFLQNLSDRRQSRGDPSHGEKPAEVQHSLISRPNFIKLKRPRKPYVKQGKRRPIF